MGGYGGLGAAEFVAHTPNSSGVWHGLYDHLTKVQRLAADFGLEAGIGAAATGAAGLWHDVGKMSPQFQKYLEVAADDQAQAKKQFRVGHKTAGAVWSLETAITACIARNLVLPLTILGHHGGIPSKSALVDLDRCERPEVVEALAIVRDVDLFAIPEGQFIPDWLESMIRASGRDGMLDIDFFTRIVFSCLVDADSLDTESHFDPVRSTARRREPVAIADLEDRVVSNIDAFVADRSQDPVTRFRIQIADQICSRSSHEPGLFTLTAPTGAGKTIASLRFALAHAREHNLRRVVMAVPYISITEQNADVFRSLLVDATGNDAQNIVLEHHSSVGISGSSEWEMRLRSQNWDAEVVVTTTVQLLESLFSNRPGKCRKVHRLAKSVVLIDEVQSLPWELLDPTCVMLRNLCDVGGSTVVLMTATQPPVEKLLALKNFPPVELLDNRSAWFEKFQRVKVKWKPAPMEWNDVADMVLSAAQSADGQALVVVNTIADAAALTSSMTGTDGLIHLSTRLCGAHRREVLKEVRGRLDRLEPVVLVATQVVEAGVDVSFPVGFRALGPATSIAQVEGRINRHGSLSEAELTVFVPADGNTPPNMYKHATAQTLKLLDAGVEVTTPEGIDEFYDGLHAAFGSITDQRGIHDRRIHLDFPEVARRYRLIDEQSQSVLVRYGEYEVVSKLLESANPDDNRAFRRLVRQLQPWLVSLRQTDFDQALADGLIEEHNDFSGIFEWVGDYDPVLGVTFSGGTNLW